MIATRASLLSCMGIAVLPALAPPVPEAADKLAQLAGTLSGTWSITETTEPAEPGGKPVTRHGEERWWVPSSGMPLVREVHLSGAEGESDDVVTLWWDATNRQYKGIYCSWSNSQGCSHLTLEWTKSQAIMKGSYQRGSKSRRFLDVYTFDTPGSFTRTHAVAESAMELQRVSTTRGTIVKVKAH